MSSNSNIRKFIGYRGTTREWLEKAVKKREFSISKGNDEYFGYGIYFFEDDPIEAYNWAYYQRKIERKNVGVIEVEIIVEKQKVFDLMLNEYYQEYIELVEKLYKKLNSKKPKLKEPVDCKLINMICEKEGFKLVRGPYNPKKQLTMELINKSATRIPKMHIQLCVRNADIIHNIKEYKSKFKKELYLEGDLA